MIKKIATILFIITSFVFCSAVFAKHHNSWERVKVRDYTKKDGTHVDSYERHYPNQNRDSIVY